MSEKSPTAEAMAAAEKVEVEVEVECMGADEDSEASVAAEEAVPKAVRETARQRGRYKRSAEGHARFGYATVTCRM